MTRQVLDEALRFESIVIKFRDTFIVDDPDENNTDAKLEQLSKLVKKLEERQSFWMNFSNYEKRVRGIADFLARMDDRFRALYGTTLLLGGGFYMSYGSDAKFKDNIDKILDAHKNVKDIIPDLVSKFDDEETLRIQEAYHTLVQGCYWSAVINSAVALEKRLFTILKSRNTKFLKQTKSNLRFSLGELIGVYIDNKKRFQICIPHRHDNLLTLVNDYRIISAHSKQFDIDRATADAIFNLTLKFLIDDDCRPINRKRKKSP